MSDMEVCYFDIENVMRPEHLFEPYSGFKADKGACLGFGYCDIAGEAHYLCNSRKDFENDPYNDYLIIEGSLELLHSAKQIVSWYGTRHDLPYINSRALILNRIHGNNNLKVCDRYTPASGHHDLYRISKGKLSMSRNKLDVAAMQIGKTRKKKSSQAWWVQCMVGNYGALLDMMDYCAYDVLSLRDLHKPFMPLQQAQRRGLNNSMRVCPVEGCASPAVHIHDRYNTVAGHVKVVLRCKGCGKSWTLSESQWNKTQKSK